MTGSTSPNASSAPQVPIAPRVAPLWTDLGYRLRAQWKIKLVATPLLMGAFFVGYFFALKTPLFPVKIMPLIAFDAVVPFAPAALPLYLSLWVYVLLALALVSARRELFIYGQSVIGLATIGVGIFLLFPTAVPAPDIQWPEHPEFLFLKTVDATGNACPSLHVAFAVFSAMWLHRLLRVMRDPGIFRALSWLWGMGIVYSTMATKQHVAVDVFAGTALGFAAAALGLRRVEAEEARSHSDDRDPANALGSTIRSCGVLADDPTKFETGLNVEMRKSRTRN
ncbi:MAG: phosphatase PAP2 family protein [Opitutaceae bacterium]